MKQLLLTLATLSLSFTLTMSSQAQTAEIDSLRGELQKADSDSLIWDLSSELSGKFRYRDRDSALKYARISYQVSKELSTYTQGLANKNMGYSYGQTRFHRDSAVWYLRKAQQSFLVAQDTLHWLEATHGIANIYSDAAEYNSSIQTLLKGLRMIENSGRQKFQDQRTLLLYGLGRSESQRGQSKSAIPYFHRVLRRAKANKDIPHEAMSYIGLGASHERLDQNDSAAYYNNLALPMAIKFEQVSLIGEIQNNLGYIRIKQENYQDALSHLEASRSAYEKAKAEGDALPAYTNSITALTRLGRLKEARAFVEKAEALGQKSKDLWGQSYLYSALIELRKAERKYEDAIKYAEKLLVIKDSLSAKENRRALNDAKVKYETEQKEAELALSKERLAKEEASAQRNLAVAGGAGILALVIGGGLYRTRQLNNRLNETNNQLIDSNGALNSKTEELQATTEELRATLETNEKLRKASEGSAELLKTEKSYLTFLKDTEVELLENSEKNMQLKSGALVHDLENESSKKALRLNIDYKQAYERLLQRLEFSVAKFEGNLPSALTDSLEKQVFPILKDLADDYQLKKELQINADLQFPDSISLSPKKAAYLYEAAYELGRNAIKHAFQDTTQPQLNFQLWTQDDSVFLSVADNGAGLPNGFDLKKRSTLKTVKGPLKSNESLDYKTSSEGASFLITLKI